MLQLKDYDSLGQPLQVVTMSDGSTISVYSAGHKIQRNADGTAIIERTDGIKVTLLEDWTIESFPDGSRRQRNPKSGQQVYVRSDGSTRQRNVDGSIVLRHCAASGGGTFQRNADGIEIRVAGDGSRSQEFPDKTCIKVTAEGKQYQVNADGAAFRIVPGGQINQIGTDEVPKIAADKVLNDQGWDKEESVKAEMSSMLPSAPSASSATSTGTTTVSGIATNKTSANASPPPGIFAKNSGGKGVAASAFTSSSSQGMNVQAQADRFNALANTRSAPNNKSAARVKVRSTAISRLSRKAESSESSGASSTHALEQRIADLTKENSSLKGALQAVKEQSNLELDKALREAQRETGEMVEELAETRERAARCTELEDALLKAQSELEASQKQLKREVDEMTEAMLESDRQLQRERKAAAEAAARHAGESAELRAQITAAANTSANQGVDRAKELSEAESALLQAKAESARLTDSLEVAQLENKELRVKADKAAAAKEQACAMEDEISKLHAQVEDLIYRGGSAAEKLVAMRSEKDAAVTERDAAHDKVAELTGKLVQTVSQLTEREVEVRALYDEMAVLREDAAIAAAAENPDLVPELLAAERARGEELEQKLNDALALGSSFAAQLEADGSAQGSHDAIRQQLNLAKRANETLRRELEKATAKQDSLQAKLDAASAAGSMTSAETSDPAASSAGFEELRLQLAKSKRELEESRKRIADLEALQTISSATPVIEPAAAPSAAPMRPPNPLLGGLLGEISAGKALKKATPQVSTNSGGGNSPSSFTTAPLSPAGSSIAELCQLKAKQRAEKATRVDDTLRHQKSLAGAEKDSKSSELAKALAKRGMAA